MARSTRDPFFIHSLHYISIVVDLLCVTLSIALILALLQRGFTVAQAPSCRVKCTMIAARIQLSKILFSPARSPQKLYISRNTALAGVSKKTTMLGVDAVLVINHCFKAIGPEIFVSKQSVSTLRIRMCQPSF